MPGKPNQDRSGVDRGELPAENVRELVSAIRQNLAGAGADMRTIELLMEQGDTDGLLRAVERLRRQLEAIDHKVTLAINHREPVK